MHKLCPSGTAYRGQRCPCCVKVKRNHGHTYGWEWDKLSTRYRIDNPLCEDCDANGIIEPSREVHHIVPIDEDPSLKYTLSNLVALCKGCHKRRHRDLGSQKK